MFKNADIGPVCPVGNPRMYVQTVAGEDHCLIRVLKGKLARLTQRVPTLRIEQIHVVMQEFVVGIPTTWIHLLRQVARVVLHYREAQEAIIDEKVEEQA